MQIILNDQFRPSQGNLKKRAKSNLRAGLTTTMGWLKVSYQRDVKVDAIMASRINDLQDNIAKVNTLIADLEDAEQLADHERQSEELKNNLKALQDQAEVYRSEGLVIDRVLTENITVSENVTDTESYLDADWIDEMIPMSRGRCKDMFGFAPDTAITYTKDGRPADKTRTVNGVQVAIGDKERDDTEFLRIHEVWNKGSNIVFVLCEGYDGYMREPKPPKITGERWYPYFLWAPIMVDGAFIPESYVDQLQSLQDEYNETRTNLREHRKNTIPHWVGLKEYISEEDADKLKNPKPFELTLIDGETGVPVTHYLALMQQPPIDPAVYDTTQTRVDFEIVSGQGDAARGVVAKPKTLGEAEIVEQGLATRMGEMQDTNEDMMQEIAQYAAELLLQELTEQQVQRIAGPGSIWPQLTRDEIFDMVQIQIRAGSTGKPDKNRERETWIQFLPLLKDTLVQVSELRGGGQDDLAEGLVKLAQESLRRFDERLDIEEFFPKKQEGEVDPKELQRMQQQQDAARQQAQLAQAQITEIWSKALKNVADAEAAEAGQQFAQYMEQMNMLVSLLQPQQQAAGPQTLQ